MEAEKSFSNIVQNSEKNENVVLHSGSSTSNPSWFELQNVWFYLNRFCREVNKLPLHQDIKDSARISLDIYSGALHSPFSPFYIIKALNGKLTVLGDFQPPYTDLDRAS